MAAPPDPAAEAGKEQEALRELRSAEEQIHCDLKRYADCVYPKLEDDRREAVELKMLDRRKARRVQFDDHINSMSSGCPTPRGTVAVHANNPHVPPADNPDDTTTAALVPPPPPGSPPRCSAAPARAPPTPTPPGESRQPVASVAQHVPQTEDAWRTMFPSRHVPAMFRETERDAFSCPDQYVIAAQSVSCLLALHNEVGFAALREELCGKEKDFEMTKTNGNGERNLEFMALSPLLLTRVGVSSIITDNHFDDNHIDHHIADNPFGPFVGSSH